MVSLGLHDMVTVMEAIPSIHSYTSVQFNMAIVRFGFEIIMTVLDAVLFTFVITNDRMLEYA